LRVEKLEAYTANLIAEAIYAKIDDEGYSHMMMDEIVDHKMIIQQWDMMTLCHSQWQETLQENHQRLEAMRQMERR
jgi:hypothetical protein